MKRTLQIMFHKNGLEYIEMVYEDKSRMIYPKIDYLIKYRLIVVDMIRFD